MARSLAVLRQCDQSLCDELDVVGVDVETEQYQATRCHSTHAVQELERLQDEVLTVLTVLLFTEVVLWEHIKPRSLNII